MTFNGFTAILGLVISIAALSACAPDTLPPQSANGNAPHRVARVTYQCDDGSKMSVRYPVPSVAVVPYEDKERHMAIARSADGARYVGKKFEWWTRGTGDGAEATVFEHRDDGKTGKRLLQCHQISSTRR